jgi:hypothetical protein
VKRARAAKRTSTAKTIRSGRERTRGLKLKRHVRVPTNGKCKGEATTAQGKPARIQPVRAAGDNSGNTPNRDFARAFKLENHLPHPPASGAALTAVTVWEEYRDWLQWVLDRTLMTGGKGAKLTTSR